MTAPPTDDPSDLVVGAVLRASRAMIAISSRSLAEVDEGLSMAQFRALVVLADGGAVDLGHLAARLDVAPSTALRTVDRLVDLDLVTRVENATDRRQVVLAPTEEGHRAATEVLRRRRAEVARAVARMSAPTQELVRAFEDLAEAVETSPPSAPSAPSAPSVPSARTPTSLGW